MYTWYRVQDENEIHDIDELKIGQAKRGTWHFRACCQFDADPCLTKAYIIYIYSWVGKLNQLHAPTHRPGWV